MYKPGYMKTFHTLAALILFSAFAFAGNGEPKKHGDKYCAKLKDGKIVVMYQGSALTSDVTLENGIQIKTDGVILRKDGTRNTLSEGECVDKEGKLVEKNKDPEKPKEKPEKKKSPHK